VETVTLVALERTGEPLVVAHRRVDGDLLAAAVRLLAAAEAKFRLHPLLRPETHLTDDVRLQGLTLLGKAALHVPKNAGSRDIARARAAAFKWNGDLSGPDTAFPVLDPAYHRRKKLLLHVCCGPDAGGVVAQLKEEFDLVTFWYDPNIQPKEEYDKRLEAFLKVAAIEGVPAVVGEYAPEGFLKAIRGLEHTPERGAKCSKCYDLRLDRAAEEAQRRGCDFFSTTLAISPHKVQAKLSGFGCVAGAKHGVPYYSRNFMKDDGFKDSVAYTKEHDIFRQDYCGCWFSLFEGGPAARAAAEALGLGAEALARRTFTTPAASASIEHHYQSQHRGDFVHVG